MIYRDFLNREYQKIFPVIMLWFFSCCVFLSFFKDLTVVGFRWDWFAIRLFYPFLIITTIFLFRRYEFFRRNYEFSSWVAVIYVASYATYFSGSNGNIESTYFLAIISALAGLSMMPIGRLSFYGIFVSCCTIFFGVNIFSFGPKNFEILATVLPYLPVSAFLIAIYELFVVRRKREYRIQEKLSFHLAQQDEMIIRQSKVLADAQTDIQVGRIAAQVAHDIQSPLGVALSSLQQLSETDTNNVRLAQSAVMRLKAISDRLLDSRSAYSSEEIENIDIVPLISQVVEEKRAYANLCKKSVQFKFETPTSVSSLVNSLDFTRVISNLIKNSLEAIQEAGEINIEIKETPNQVVLVISDNGKGIPRAIASDIFKRGFTFGKENGHGLGLSNAKEVLERWGGIISVRERSGGGTQVRLVMQRIAMPESSYGNLIEYVLVDDNPLTHVSWQGSAEKHDIKLKTFFDPSQLTEYLDIIPRRAKIYVDYKFGNRTTGLSFAKKIREQGFQHVYISTGMRNPEILQAAKSFPIVTKEPPWLRTQTDSIFNIE